MDKTAASCFDRLISNQIHYLPTMLKMTSRISCLKAVCTLAVTLGFGFGVQNASAQFGVSPSQTSTFFDDFRARSSQMQKGGAGVRNGDVMYDYDSGTYVGTESEGQARSEDLLQQAREVAQPAVRSGSAAFAARSVGDYTNYSGQYSSPTGFFAPTYTSDPFLAGKRNVKLGPVNIGLGLYQGFEYNSNINRSNTQPLSDFISTTMLSIDANYRITQNNVLSLTTAIGFDHYFSHPEVAPYGNGNYILNVLPGSTLAFDVKAGPLYFTFYDRVSVRPAVNNAFTLNAQSIFGVFQNDAGFAMNWAINSKWSLALNFNNSISRALQGAFSQFNRMVNTIQGTLTFSPQGTWSTGLEGGVSLLSYEQPILNDGTLTNAGVFFRTPIGRSTFIKVSGGVQIFEFEDPSVLPPLGPGDSSDLNDYYFTVSVNNQINNRLSHSLSFGHESALNLTSNFITADFINYGISMVTSKGGRLSLTGYFERAEPSDTAPGFLTPQQDLIQYGFDLYYNHQITSKIRMGAGYHFGVTDSKAATGDFDQHAFNIDFNTMLTQKASVNLGYRYFMTNTYNNNQDFDQHRFILGLNYNF